MFEPIPLPAHLAAAASDVLSLEPPSLRALCRMAQLGAYWENPQIVAEFIQRGWGEPNGVGVLPTAAGSAAIGALYFLYTIERDSNGFRPMMTLKGARA